METPAQFVGRLKETACQLGFTHCGITGAGPMPDEELRFRGWLERNWHAGAGYLERNIEERFNPSLLLEGATSVISMAFPYGDARLAGGNRSGISVYAWGEDYHHRLPRLAAPLLEMLTGYDPSSGHRFFVDSSSLSERSVAVRAGLGWIGKNGTLITRERGSMHYLAEIITTIQLPADQPFKDNLCGGCTLCMEGCPTGAIVSPGLIDSSRCIAWHTNSSKKPIPEGIAARLGGRIFGCDICQQVCPWNDPARHTLPAEKQLLPYPSHWPSEPCEWQGMNEQWFREHFSGSAPGHKGFKKLSENVSVACHFSPGNSAQPKDGN